MAQFTQLAQWLTYLETIHKSEIDLGLQRVAQMKERLQDAGLLKLNYPIITVGGTNGKGSTCAYLEQILIAAGYRVGCHTSPHILDFTERGRFNGVDATEAQLLPFLQEVERIRLQAPEISLTYFEFTLMVLMCWFDAQKPDAVVLEVGLGGRLDASNVFDSAVSIVTMVDLDHQGFLGDTREVIGFEKAGIFRAGCVAICADPNPPQSLLDYAQFIGADLKLINRDFRYQVVQDDQRKQWRFVGVRGARNSLAMPAMRGDYQLANASAALAALEALAEILSVTQQAVRLGISNAVMRGRFQVLPGQPTTVLDVAHNPHAARALAKNIQQMGYAPYTHAVFGAMADKDIAQVMLIMRDVVDRWYLCDLPSARAASALELTEILQATGFVADENHSVQQFTSVQEALKHLSAGLPTRVAPNDRIIVFGSFVTVEQAIKGMPQFPAGTTLH